MIINDLASVCCDIGQQLKKARIHRGYSLRELSALTGIGYAHICRIEQGIHPPTTATLKRLCHALDARIFLKLK